MRRRADGWFQRYEPVGGWSYLWLPWWRWLKEQHFYHFFTYLPSSTIPSEFCTYSLATSLWFLLAISPHILNFLILASQTLSPSLFFYIPHCYGNLSVFWILVSFPKELSNFYLQLIFTFKLQTHIFYCIFYISI